MSGLGIGISPVLGSGLSSFLPTDISGLLLWLDAEQGTYQDSVKTTPATADADKIGAWEDQSGSGNDLLQTTAGLRPELKLNIVDSSRPVIRCDATAKTTLTKTVALAQPLDIFLVGSYTFSANNFILGMLTTNFFFAHRNSSGLCRVTTSAGDILASGLAIGSFHLINIQVNGASSEILQDGVSLQTGDLGSTAASGVVLAQRSGGSNTSSVDFAEILIYNSILSDLNRAAVKDYLDLRYGL